MSYSQYLSSTCKKCMLSLFFLVATLQYCEAMKGNKNKNKSVADKMKVAAIRAANQNDTFIRVTFLQSQRFYKLSNHADPAYLKLLKESAKNNTPVIIKRVSEQSDMILSVVKAK